MIKTIIHLFILVLALILIANTASAVDGDVIYVNNATGNDVNDGFTQATAKLTIKNATGTVNLNGIVNIADGTYTGSGNYNLTISKNMTITGQSKEGTIIDAQEQDRIFNILAITVTIQNLTVRNGNTTDYGGTIYNNGTLNIFNTYFSYNHAGETFGNGRGGVIYSTGILNIADSIFKSNSGDYCNVIYNTGNATITGSDFEDNNKNTESGGAIHNGGNLVIKNSIFKNNHAGWGGAIENDGNLTVTGSSFINNIVNVQVGAICNDNGTIIITGCNFENNKVLTRINREPSTDPEYIPQGAAIWSSTTIKNVVKYSRFIGNSIYIVKEFTLDPLKMQLLRSEDIFVYSGSLDARYNWWGSNSGPAKSRVI